MMDKKNIVVWEIHDYTVNTPIKYMKKCVRIFYF